MSIGYDSQSNDGSIGSWSWWGSLFQPGSQAPHTTRRQRRFLAEQGYVKVKGRPVWISPTGERIKGQVRAIKTVKQLKRQGAAAPVQQYAADNPPYPLPTVVQPQGNEPWQPPTGGDSDYEKAWEEMGLGEMEYQDWWGWWNGTDTGPYHPLPQQSFVGIPPAVPGLELPTAEDVGEVVGVISEVAKHIPAAARATLARLILGPFLILWPTSTADDDVIVDPRPLPLPRRKPGGPGQRVKVRKPPKPTIIRPYPVPGDRPRPDAKPSPRPTPKPGAVPAPEIPAPAREPRPQTSPKPASRPAPRPAPAPGLPSPAIPGMPLSIFSPRATPNRVRLPNRKPGDDTAPDPLTLFQPQAVPSPAEACQCDKPRRRKKSCSNPIVSRKKSTRGGRRYITTTRRIECQA